MRLGLHSADNPRDFAYRRAWMGWEFHPHIRKISLTLLGLDSLISVFCLVMMIGSIKMWLGV